MLSNFSGIVLPILKGRGVNLIQPQINRIKEMERELNSEKIDIAGAIKFLKWEEYKFDLTNDDYRKIEKELGYNVK